MIKRKGAYYKCTDCTAIFTIEAQDNCTELNYCPTCGAKNENSKTRDIFCTKAPCDNRDFDQESKDWWSRSNPGG